MMNMQSITYSDEVYEALNSGKPVVAIETAGTFEAFSYPTNKELAERVMDSIRKAGAVPAYIAIIAGELKVGLNPQDVEYLARKTGLMKASRRDLPMLLAQKRDALTAVAAAMTVANLTGIQVVTGGGIGGVHRGASTSFDISADLQEFTLSNVAVVCSGAKSILDIKLTMEYLETHSVSIVGYQTLEMPAYLEVHSGCKLDFAVESPDEAARCLVTKQQLGLPGGILVVNPIDSQYAVDAEKMKAAIDKAVQSAEENGIQGKIITKYIMDIVKAEMGADSTEASIHMNIDNAVLAAQIACSIAKL